MRNMLLAALVTSAASPSPADAWGPYEVQPRAFVVSWHGISQPDGWTTRSFVLLGGGIPAGVKLAMLAPRTYDGTRFADAPDLDTPMTFTLVGSSSTRVVESASRFWVAPAWQGPKGAALEVTPDPEPQSETQIALAGRHADATWIALDHRASKGSVSVNRVHGTDIDTLTSYSEGKATTLVRVPGERQREVAGSPIGVVEMDGDRFLVTRRDTGAVMTRL